MSAKSNSKWKDALLKTSLPLEYLVAQKLDKKKFEVYGEYSFSRKNEQGLDTEFSVDLHAISELRERKGQSWGMLNFLIECKYNYPGVKWIFSPRPKNSVLFTGVVSKFQDLCTKRISDSSSLEALDDIFPYCVKGIELHESDANVQSISRGLHQLRWAIPQLAASCLRNQATTGHDEDLHIEFICPILVTTASLHIFREVPNLETFHKASDITDVTEEVKALVVYQEHGPQLSQYMQDIWSTLHAKTPQIKTRLDSLHQLRVSEKIQTIAPLEIEYYVSRNYLAKHVLVVTLDAFEEVMTNVIKAVKECGQKLRRIALLTYDQKSRGGNIVSYKSK